MLLARTYKSQFETLKLKKKTIQKLQILPFLFLDTNLSLNTLFTHPYLNNLYTNNIKGVKSTKEKNCSYLSIAIALNKM